MPTIPTPRINPVSVEDVGANVIKLFTSAFRLLVTVQTYGKRKNN